jgi:signal transduction histidine kinase/ActR/RegA family two-component response regulator
MLFPFFSQNIFQKQTVFLAFIFPKEYTCVVSFPAQAAARPRRWPRGGAAPARGAEPCSGGADKNERGDRIKVKKKLYRGARGRLAAIVLGAVLIVLAACSLSLFLYFNTQSRLTVQAERENYTSEISDQLTRNIDNLQNSYAREVRNSARALLSLQPGTLEEVGVSLPDRKNAAHFLVADSGRVIDYAGRAYTLSDEFFTSDLALSEEDEVVMTYTTLNLAHDYLLFGKRIPPLTIGETTYVAWAVGVTSDQFRQNMTISLFNGLGAGYLISGDGSIVIKPDNNSMTFSGYNLFSSLSAGGVSDDQLGRFKAGMKAGGCALSVAVSGIDWLISCKSTEFDGDYIVVAVPLSLTAADTYRSMGLAVVFSFVFILALAGILGLSLLYATRRRQEENQRAAAVDAQTSFLAKMSHDIRTPLNAVTGMLELASDPNHSRAEVDDFVSKARKSAAYLLELVNGMLDLQKINSGKMETAHEPFSVAELLESIDSMYRPVLKEKGLAFSLEGAGQFDTAYIGDGVKVKQILMNLLSNAMKFTAAGGCVAVCAARAPLDQGTDEVQFTVTDTGIGMSEEFQKRIFQPFEQEKASSTSGYVGTGLGLNIVKNLTELLGGTVSVTSKVGAGSSFSIRLPMKRGDALPPAVSRAEAGQIVPFHRQRILLAEDNAINQQIAVLLMRERMNLEVDAVDNGKEAVEAMARSAPGYYAAIVLDVRMPVMDGLQAAAAIRALKRPDAKTIPILALSANTYEEDVRRSLDAGKNAHLAKPIEVAELSAALHKYMQ